MKLGLHLYDFTWPAGASQMGPTLVQIAQTAEAAGFDRISTMDHVWQSHYLGGPEREVLSCYPTLTYLAAHTSRSSCSPWQRRARTGIPSYSPKRSLPWTCSPVAVRGWALGLAIMKKRQQGQGYLSLH